MAPQSRWSDFRCPDYNLLFARPDANVALRTADEDNAPVLAFWQRGLGRVVALALDPNRSFAQNDQYGDIMLSAARWAMGSSVSDYEGSFANVRMEVSQEERDRAGAPEMIVFTPSGKSIRRTMHWSAYDQLSASVRITEPGLHRGIVRIGGQEYKIGPISRPVSPEFQQRGHPDFGRDVMRDLARMTNGERVQNLSSVFQRTDLTSTVQPITHWLLISFLLVMICEIAEARFHMLDYLARWQHAARQRLPQRLRPRRAAQRNVKAAGPAASPPAAGRPMDGEPEPVPSPSSTASDKPPAAPASSEDMDYLRESKSRARRKMG
jgi:hypothetical protein